MDIDKDEFLERIEEAFEFRVSGLDLGTQFKELKEWDSLASVSIVAMVYADYDVQISGTELVDCESLGELKNSIESKVAELV